MSEPLLDVRGLRTVFDTPAGAITVVDGISFHVGRGEVVGLVGESGCGKSVTAYSLLRLVSRPGRIAGGQALLEGRDLMQLDEKGMQGVRGNRISMVFQEPTTSLNPVLTVGFQIAEAIMLHQGKNKRDAMAGAVDMMRQVSIPEPEQRSREYPHQMSGGMLQRAMIAMALSCKPALLLADEPTTALDVTIQAQILDLLGELKESMDLSVLLITHDLGVVAEMADRVLVMYAGQIVEEAPVGELFRSPQHPYTKGLLRSLPRIGDRSARLTAIEGTVPDMGALPPGCRFEPRCQERMPHCSSAIPASHEVAPGRRVACFLHHDRTVDGGRVRVDESAAREGS